MKLLLAVSLFTLAAYSQTTKFTDGTDPDVQFTSVQEYSYGKTPKEMLTAAQTITTADDSAPNNFQANTVASYTENRSKGTINVVGAYVQNVAYNGGASWAGNDIVEDRTPEGQKGGIIFGREINAQTFNSTSTVVGLLINGNGTKAPENSFALLVGPIGQLRKPKLPWTYGIVIDEQSALVPLTIYPQSPEPTANSGVIRFYARNKGKYVALTLWASPDGKLCIMSASVRCL